MSEIASTSTIGVPLRPGPRLTTALVLAAGIAARIAISFAGHNFDPESYRIVADIMARGGNVYAETSRYNYAPAWFLILHGLDLLPDFAMSAFDALRLKVTVLLTLADLGIWGLLYRRYGAPVAALFLLNPLSILITGYHGQFDNLAVLIALAAMTIMGEDCPGGSAGRRGLNGRWLAGLALVGLSLCVKHLLFVFPAWLALKEPTWRRKLVAAGLPAGIFLASFLPWWQTGHAGIADHVFGYHSSDNAPIWQMLLPHMLYFALPKTAMFVAALGLTGLVARERSRWESLLIYLVALVAFSPAISNQYLAIPLAALAVWWNRTFRFYTVLATLFVLVQADGLGLATQINPAATLYGPVSQLAYTACALVLGVGLVQELASAAARAALARHWQSFTGWLEREIVGQFRAPL